jgi:hypothetical protein
MFGASSSKSSICLPPPTKSNSGTASGAGARIGAPCATGRPQRAHSVLGLTISALHHGQTADIAGIITEIGPTRVKRDFPRQNEGARVPFSHMRLYSSKVPSIAQEIARMLLAANDIESESPREVEADIEAVLNSYLQTEKEVTERTKELLDRTGRSMSEFGRVKGQVAESKGIKTGEDTLDYLLDQIVEMFHHSHNVDEIYAEDVALRRKMAPIFKKHMLMDEALDAEVRAQLKHVTEGSRTWDIEYQRVMEQIKQKRGVR